MIGRTRNTSVTVRRVGRRPIPIAPLTITGTATGSAQTFHTCGADRVTEVMSLHVRNTTGTAATLTFHAVPDGGSIGDTNELLPSLNVPANTTLRIDGLLGGGFLPDTTLEVFSGTTSALAIWGTVEEVE